MKKLLLSACVAAAAFWTSDVEATGKQYNKRLSNENGYIYGGKELDVSSSHRNKELLSQYKEFPNVEVLTADLNVFQVEYRTTCRISHHFWHNLPRKTTCVRFK